MATNTLKTIIKLRRDLEQNYDKIGSSYIPLKGEVVLVDTDSNGLRAKVGDGTTPYKNLDWVDTELYDAIDSVVMQGYYMNNLFWTDSSYLVQLPKSVNRIYIDKTSKVIFHYDGSKYISVNSTLPTASDAIAGIQINNGITTEQLSDADALNLKALAHAATASGSDTVDTIDSITMKEMTIAGNAAVTTTSTDATIATKANFTPAGSITGTAISGGSIDVTVKDAANKTEADLTTSTYTPAGTVSGTVSVPNSASISEASAEETGFTITGTVSKPAITVTPTTATVQEMKTAGTAYSITDGSVTKGNDTTAKVVKKVFKFEIDSEDEEQLNIVEVASTDTTYFMDAVTASGTITYTKQELSGALPTFGASSDLVTGATAALDENPSFTGRKVKVSLANADASIDASFTATNSANVPNKVEYYKQEIDTKTFTPTAATLGFSGTEVENLIPTKITYDKADATAAFSVKQTPETDVLTKTAKSIDITVSAD